MTDDTQPLDLRPLLDLREPAAQLTARLLAGDLEAVQPAEALLRVEHDHYVAARVALVGLGVTDLRTVDALGLLVTELGTGDLGAVLDEVLGRDGSGE